MPSSGQGAAPSGHQRPTTISALEPATTTNRRSSLGVLIKELASAAPFPIVLVEGSDSYNQVALIRMRGKRTIESQMKHLYEYARVDGKDVFQPQLEESEYCLNLCMG